MTHGEKVSRVAYLMSRQSWHRTEMARIQHELDKLTGHDPAGEAILRQRKDARRMPDPELLAAMLDGITIDWVPVEWGSGDDLG